MIRLDRIKLKCPNCEANLTVSSDREFFFCEYCGARIAADEKNRYTYRRIDEARIREADAAENIRMKELEIEQQKMRSEQRLFAVWAAAVILLTVLMVITWNGAGGLGGGLFVLDLIVLVSGLRALKRRRKNK